MLDSSPGRGSAATQRAAAPSRRNTGGQPQRSKAERRAEAKAAKARAHAMRKRRQALTVGGAVVGVGGLVWYLLSGPKEHDTTAAKIAPMVRANGFQLSF